MGPIDSAAGLSLALDASSLGALRWGEVFGNERPVELEIGIGKGGFLLRRAQALPERNFVGIEWAGEFYRYALDRMQRWRVGNVRILRTDASYFLRHQCPRNTLMALHVYHPDPWPKRRHYKRRLFQPAFVEAVAGCLVVGGRLAVQTDHREYYEWIRPMLLACAALRETPFESQEFGADGARVATNYELKYLREGRAIYQMAMVRCEAGSVDPP